MAPPSLSYMALHNGPVAEMQDATEQHDDGDVGSGSSGRWNLRDGVISASWSICTGHAGDFVPIAG